jgi:hypothetical protein
MTAFRAKECHCPGTEQALEVVAVTQTNATSTGSCTSRQPPERSLEHFHIRKVEDLSRMRLFAQVFNTSHPCFTEIHRVITLEKYC